VDPAARGGDDAGSNALAFVEWAVGLLELTSEDRLSNHVAFNFDLSVFDLYGAFASGAPVHLVPAAAPDAAAVLVTSWQN